jgi:hypothetical protein
VSRLPRRTGLSWVALAVALGLTTACGSTVQYRGTAAVGDGAALGALDGSQVPSTTGQQGTSGTGSSTASGATGTSTGPVAAPSGGGAAPSGASGSTGTTGAGPLTPGGPESGRGFTRTTIRIGVGTASDYNSVAGTFGLKGLGYEGDPNVWFDAVTNELNKNGGLLGRKVELVKHDFSTAQQLNDPAGANQGACTTWTQDKPVFAVLLAGFVVEDTLLSCLQSAGTLLISVGGGLDYPLHYSDSYARFPLFFNLDQMEGDRFDRIAIGRLVARTFFSPWDTRAGRPGTSATPVKVGIVGFSDHEGQTQLASQQRQLARYGLKSKDVIQCSRVLTEKISCEQSAVLRFVSSGVTHVFGADSTFMSNANSQSYYPRYFVPVEPALFAANVPAKQLVGAMSESYIPLLDTPSNKYPGDPTPAATHCRKLMKAAGQSSSDPLTLWLQMSVCDEFFFFRAAVLKAGQLGPGAMRAGMEALGSSVPSALTWTATFSPKVHASAVAVRDLVFDEGISNFVYISATNHGDS